MKTDIPTYKRAAIQMYHLKYYILDFYVNKLGITDSVQWHEHPVVWAQALSSQSGGFSTKVRQERQKHYKK